MILIISHTQLSGINFMIVLVIRIAFPGKQGKKLSATKIYSASRVKSVLRWRFCISPLHDVK